MTAKIDVQDEAGGVIKVSAVEEALDGVEDFGLEAMQLQHALNCCQHAGVIVEENYLLFAVRHHRRSPRRAERLDDVRPTSTGSLLFQSLVRINKRHFDVCNFRRQG